MDESNQQENETNPHRFASFHPHLLVGQNHLFPNTLITSTKLFTMQKKKDDSSHASQRSFRVAISSSHQSVITVVDES